MGNDGERNSEGGAAGGAALGLEGVKKLGEAVRATRRVSTKMRCAGG